jgi:hypothetical protein
MIDEERIRKFVEKKIEERNGLLIHFAIFLFMNLLFIGGWLGGFDGNFHRVVSELPGPLIITFFWGIGMFAHFMDYSNKYGRGRERREALVQRELERERERLRRMKLKNDDLFYDETGENYVEEIEEERRKHR